MRRRRRLAGQGREELLLVLRTVQVAAREGVPRPDEGQRLLAVQGLLARLEVGAGLLVLEGLRDVDLHAADRVHDVGEAGEADLGVVVDAQAGVVLDGADQQLGAVLRVRRVQLHPAALRREELAGLASP